jgi:hypothetical protein
LGVARQNPEKNTNSHETFWGKPLAPGSTAMSSLRTQKKTKKNTTHVLMITGSPEQTAEKPG